MTPTAAAIAPILYPDRCEVHTLGIAQGCPVHHVQHVASMAEAAALIFLAIMIAATTNAIITHRS